jgi:hypothetical protein
MRSGEICGLMAEDVTHKGNLGRFIQISQTLYGSSSQKQLNGKYALHQTLEQLLDTSLPKQGRLFPYLTVDAVVKRYAKA